MRLNILFCKNFDRFEFSRVLLVSLNCAAVNINKNSVKILTEQNVRPHLSASDATLVGKKRQRYLLKFLNGPNLKMRHDMGYS